MSAIDEKRSSSLMTHWIHSDFAAEIEDDPTNAAHHVECLCIGTGRFLRAVLVPLLSSHNTVLVQPRGRSFMEYMANHHDRSAATTASLESSHDPPPPRRSVAASFEVDTVLASGQVVTDHIPCAAVFSWGQPSDEEAFYEHLPSLVGNPTTSGFPLLSMLGLGVTEAGLASPDTPIMQKVYRLLATLCDLQDKQQQHQHSPSSPKQNKLCVLDMDNVPQNGTMLRRHMLALASREVDEAMAARMRDYIKNDVAFLDTMVDRITSQRPGVSNGGLVPRAEPLPQKSLVVLDPQGDLPVWFVEQSKLDDSRGLVIRRTPQALQADVALKLRIANGTHTAMAHLMALLGWTMTTDGLANIESGGAASSGSDARPVLLHYLDALMENQILPGVIAAGVATSALAQEVWQDWRQRLAHPHFGLSTFFITQNGAAKGGITLSPTIVDLVQNSQGQTGGTATTTTSGIDVTTIFALAALLRWLTPDASTMTNQEENRVGTAIFQGKLQPEDKPVSVSETVTYADGLRYNLAEGWYEFRCACQVKDNITQGGFNVRNLSTWLGDLADAGPQQPLAYVKVIRAYLLEPSGGNQAAIAHTQAFEWEVQAVSVLYARMLAGDSPLLVLHEMKDGQAPYQYGFATDCVVLVDQPCIAHGRPLHYKPTAIPDTSALMQQPVTLETIDVVVSEVASTLAIDLHTHLLPPSHGPLCLWGIDELLTYHYLVAEYFMTAPPSVSPEAFYAKSKQEQADMIWTALFCERIPISEACRGVLTTLETLGLSEALRRRDLSSIRQLYASFRDRGLSGAEAFSDLVFTRAGVRYNIMTNVVMDPKEAACWRPRVKEYPHQYRSALRVDALLTGDKDAVEAALLASCYEPTLEGARQYLRDWCDTMKPEYMMASTPHDFVLKEGFDAVDNTGLNLEAMKVPGAFADASVAGCSGAEDDAPSLINEHSDFLNEVLMKVCEERNLPLALKIGAHRGVNPRLKAAGDGVVAFADGSMLARLCARFPKVRFLCTFLSRNNQHEACVLATKFRNLHIYGCWWFCNNPSIIKEITQMRIEMLGTAFTAQHSDARVIDQLLYKWPHSRAVIAGVLKEEYAKILSSWRPTRAEIRRDVGRLLGGSFEEFMTKSLM